MVKDNPIHKQQIDPISMSDRFPFYDLDGRLAATGAGWQPSKAHFTDGFQRGGWFCGRGLQIL